MQRNYYFGFVKHKISEAFVVIGNRRKRIIK